MPNTEAGTEVGGTSTAGSTPSPARPPWRAVRRYATPIAAALLGLVLSVVAFDNTHERTREDAEQRVQSVAYAYTEALQRLISLRLVVTEAFAGLFATEAGLSQAEFLRFAGHVFSSTPSLLGVSWLPRTTPTNFPAIDQAFRQDGFGALVPHGPDGRPLDPTTLGRDMFPVVMIAPLDDEGRRLLGLDMAGLPDRRQAIDAARDTGRVTATGGIDLLHAPGQGGIALYTPVYAGAVVPSDEAARRQELRGILAAVFRIDRLLEAPLVGQPAQTLDIAFFDPDSPAGHRLLHFIPAQGGEPSRPPPSEVALTDPAVWRETIAVANRTWVLAFCPPPHANAWAMWFPAALVLATGLLATALASGYLWHLVARSSRAERFGTAMSAANEALRRANAELRGEMDARRRAEDALVESNLNMQDLLLDQHRLISQKEMLLREVNHRVKNSLAMVSALLDLQRGSAHDASLRQQLAAAAGRVMAIAQVHERLYKTDSVTTVEFGQYLRLLCDDLLRTAPGGTEPWQIRVDAAAATVPTDRAVPLALLANELITNAFKHAYPDAAGERVVEVLFGRDSDGRMHLTVTDHGVGLPRGRAARRPGSLGMTLIETLTRQLGGNLTMADNQPGARFEVVLAAEGTT